MWTNRRQLPRRPQLQQQQQTLDGDGYGDCGDVIVAAAVAADGHVGAMDGGDGGGGGTRRLRLPQQLPLLPRSYCRLMRKRTTRRTMSKPTRR